MKKPDDMDMPVEEATADMSTESMSESSDLDRITAEAQTNLEGWKRAMADLENVKKRHEDMLGMMLERRQADLFREILPVMDDLRRLVAHLPADDAAMTAEQAVQFSQGAKSILKKADETLAKMGLTAIDLTGKPFDPHDAEALTEVESDQPPGTVLEVVETGYRSGELLVRPARVVVSKGPTQ